MRANYTTRTTEVETKPGCWKSTQVEIFNKDNQKVGEYLRNYSSLLNTFFSFTLDGQDYALYSPDYTSTRILRLPDCVDIGGEEPDGAGFCPADFYVPYYKVIGEGDDACYYFEPKEDEPDESRCGYVPFGFVAGCVWGDDSSWKIQFLDLSKVSQGILIRDDRFGYLELLGKSRLKDAIHLDLWTPDEDDHFIEITSRRLFSIRPSYLPDAQS